METVIDFILGGSKITADGDCSHEIKRQLFPGRKAMTNLDSILKSRDITLPTKVHLTKGMVFPVVMYECKSWTINKAEHHRVDAFELWCWGRLLRVPWTARRSIQLNLKEISPEYSLEGLMLKLKLQYFGHLMWRTDSFEKTLMLHAGGEGDDRGWDGWEASLTWWTWVRATSGSWWWTGKPGMLDPWGCKESDMPEWLNWTEGESASTYFSSFIQLWNTVNPVLFLSANKRPSYYGRHYDHTIMADIMTIPAQHFYLPPQHWNSKRVSATHFHVSKTCQKMLMGSVTVD